MLHRWFFLYCLAGLLVQGGEYYVSPTGRDSASGTDPANAWRTVARVNQHLAQPGPAGGDFIRFCGGARFAGNLVVDRSTRGTAAQPTVLGTYGSGAATVLAGDGTGVLVRESPWVCVSNLVLVAGRTNHGDGIRFDRIENTGERLTGVRIERCVTRGFGWHGIMIDAAAQDRGFADVSVIDCDATENRHAGIMVYGGNPTGRTHRAHARVEVLRCRSWGNRGDPELLAYHSGSGIFLDGVEDGRVAACAAWRNGGECRNERGGPVGIWLHASRSTVIEGCESFENRTLLRDGGGFDLDGGCERCVLRGNFAHDNDGPGIMVCSYTGAPYSDTDCVVEGNVSWNDGRRGSGYAGLHVSTEKGAHISNLLLVSNTIVAPPGAVSAVKIQGYQIGGRFAANRVLASDHAVLVSVSGYDHRLGFTANQYWRGDGRAVFLVDYAWPVASVAAWTQLAGRDGRFGEITGERFEKVVIPALPKRGPSGRAKLLRQRVPPR